MSVKHPFVNPKPDGLDKTITRPSDWNADHTILHVIPDADGIYDLGSETLQWKDLYL